MIEAGAIKGGKQLTLPVWINGAKGIAVQDAGARATMINRNIARAAGLKLDSAAYRDGPAVRGAMQQSMASRMGPSEPSVSQA
jgi:hypothetical protein